MYGYEALADALVAEDVEQVFAVAADDNVEFLVELQDKKKVGVITARKECGATGMADGYTRVTGKVGVCSVTLGPGLANAANPLFGASRHRSPLICLTTEASPFNRLVGTLKGGFNQRQFSETTAGSYICVRHAETLAEDIQSAFRHVRCGKGPVVLALPEDVMKTDLDLDWSYSASKGTPGQQRTHPDPDLIAKAVEILRQSEKPVILVGRGASDSQAAEEIKSLAEQTRALLATTLLSRYYLAGHPYHADIVGLFASKEMHSLLSEADCVIAVGCSLNLFTMESGLAFPNARIIQIDRDLSQIDKITPVTLGIVGDARASLAGLNKAIQTMNLPRKAGFWTEEVKSRITVSRASPPASYVEAPDKLDPGQLVTELDRILPRDRIVVADAGYFVRFVADSISFTDPVHLVWTVDFGSVGMGLYQGIGAAIGRPDRHVVVFSGDGGFMMTLEELDTAVRHRIPMTMVVMNDNAFGSEIHILERKGKPTDIARFGNLDLAEVARSFGAVGLTVRNVRDLQEAAKVIAREERPVVIDAKIDGSVLHPVDQELAGKSAGKS